MHATTQFQLDLASELLAVSNNIAALHASRFRKLHPAEPLPHCAKCGSFLPSTRIIRHQKRKACGTCANIQDTPVDRGNAVLFPRVKKAKSSTQMPAPQMPAQSPPPVATSSQPRPKKKKSGLREMLDRNKDKQAKEKIGKTERGGLADFLSGLQ